MSLSFTPNPSNGSSGDSRECVHAFLRIRPSTRSDVASSSSPSDGPFWMVEGDRSPPAEPPVAFIRIDGSNVVLPSELICRDNESGPQTCSFSRIFLPSADYPSDFADTSESVYLSAAAPFVESLVNDGISSSILAYGEPNSGRSTTITSLLDYSLPHLFHLVYSHPTRSFAVSVSMLHIYRGKIVDCLFESGDYRHRVQLHRYLLSRSWSDLPGMHSEPQAYCVKSEDEARGVIARGQRLQKMELMKLASMSNRLPTRLITIYRLTVESFDHSDTISTHAILQFIDGCGPEPTFRVRQGREISSRVYDSVRCFQRVTRQLISSSPFVPYRDSKLTRILQFCLGGGVGRLAVIGTVASHIDRMIAIKTIRFVSSMAQIENRSPRTSRWDHPNGLFLKYLIDGDVARAGLGYHSELAFHFDVSWLGKKSENEDEVLQERFEQLRECVLRSEVSLFEEEEREERFRFLMEWKGFVGSVVRIVGMIEIYDFFDCF